MGKKISFGHINHDKMSQNNFKLHNQKIFAASLSLTLLATACMHKTDSNYRFAQPVQERILLGSMMIDESIIEKVDEKLDTDSFVSESHRILFDTMVEMNDDKKDVNVESVIKEITTKGLENKVSGSIIINNVTMNVGADKLGRPVYKKIDIAKIATSSEYIEYLFANTNAAIDIDKYIEEVEANSNTSNGINVFGRARTYLRKNPKK